MHLFVELINNYEITNTFINKDLANKTQFAS